MKTSPAPGEMGCRRGLALRPGVAAAAAAVAVVGLIGLACWYVFGGGGGGTVVREGMPFHCAECGADFVKPPKELGIRELNTRPEALRVDCPACKAQSAGVPTMECPQCKRRFIPASYTNPRGKRAGTARDICSHCKTDRDEWFRAYYRKNR